jgi:hypothetical protein
LSIKKFNEWIFAEPDLLFHKRKRVTEKERNNVINATPRQPAVDNGGCIRENLLPIHIMHMHGMKLEVTHC